MLLTADMQLTGKLMIGPQKSARGIAALIDPWRVLKTAVSGQRVVNL